MKYILLLFGKELLLDCIKSYIKSKSKLLLECCFPRHSTNNAKKNKTKQDDSKPYTYNADNSFEVFDEKIRYILPGVRGYKEIKCPFRVIDLLTKFFEIPFKEYNTQQPILLRNGRTLEINSVKRLSLTYLLLANRYRFRIKRMGIYQSKYEYASFIYLEVKHDKVHFVKATPNPYGEIEFGVKDEYKCNLHYRRYISREEYDDTPNCELRICTTKRNNYLIIPKDSIYNLRGSNFGQRVDDILDDILARHKNFTDLCEFMESFRAENKDNFMYQTPSYTQNL